MPCKPGASPAADRQFIVEHRIAANEFLAQVQRIVGRREIGRDEVDLIAFVACRPPHETLVERRQQGIGRREPH